MIFFDEKMFMLNKTFSLRSLLSETEENTSYYISGYVALKENIAAVEPADGKNALQTQNLLNYYVVVNFHILLLKLLNSLVLCIIITKM